MVEGNKEGKEGKRSHNQSIITIPPVLPSGQAKIWGYDKFVSRHDMLHQGKHIL
jgi:hypothetical protein